MESIKSETATFVASRSAERPYRESTERKLRELSARALTIPPLPRESAVLPGLHRAVQPHLAFIAGLLLIAVAGYLSFVPGYGQPDGLFWDENYHIPSAQKYREGIFFQEPHPPLGKLFIAAGDWLFGDNDQLSTEYFLLTDHIREVPAGYSFRGPRFFPVIFGWLTALLLYVCMYAASGRALISVVGASLYVFDNAIIVHSRGAMLDSAQLFFCLLTLFCFLRGAQCRRPSKLPLLLLFGTALGCAVSVKLNSAVFALLIPALFAYELKKPERLPVYRTVLRLAAAGAAAAAVFVLVWFIHFNLARKVVGKRDYSASAELMEALKENRRDPVSFVYFLRDALTYGFRSHAGVPRLRIGAADENGSHPLFWPAGSKSISYRWTKTADGHFRQLRLQCNPVGWFLGGLGIFLCICLAVSRRLMGVQVAPDKRRLILPMEVIALLYLSYMAAMLAIERVMYLYHYFIPLLLSYCAAVLIAAYLLDQINTAGRNAAAGLLLLAAGVFSSYLFFSPVTYYQPLTAGQLYERGWLETWNYEPVIW